MSEVIKLACDIFSACQSGGFDTTRMLRAHLAAAPVRGKFGRTNTRDDRAAVDRYPYRATATKVASVFFDQLRNA
jgi:hypothetical protein